MVKRKQHFVPRFYLKAFQSEEKRLHLYNIKRSLQVRNVSLKDQCFKRDFYGPDGETEDRLATLESRLAPVLQSVVSTKSLPSYRSKEHDYLLFFVTLQLLRTVKSSESYKQFVDKSIKQVFSHDSRSVNVSPEGLRFAFDDPAPILMSLGVLPTMKEAISDLKVHLVWSPHQVFLTSDNPIFKYNQYCEGVHFRGVTGGGSRGLQIFVPLSPYLHLILYDDRTYRVRTWDGFLRASKATKSDVDSLNMLQLVSADKNIYFSSCGQHRDICRLFPRIQHLRSLDQIVVQEYLQAGASGSSLIHFYELPVDLSLNLTFLSLRKRALRVPLSDRPQKNRDQVPASKRFIM